MEPLLRTLSLSEFQPSPMDGPMPTPFVLDDGRELSMHFSYDATQSCMRLRTPNVLVEAYTRKMMSFLLFVPDPRHVVLIGLGGGSLAKFCYAQLPRTRITAVEINADVLALREQFKVPPDDRRFCVVHDDGACYMVKVRDKADVLLVDAFDADGIAKSLLDPLFGSACARRLTRGGIAVLNLCGERWRSLAVVEHMHAAFAGRVRLVPVANSENVLLFAFKDQVADPQGAEIESHADNLRARLHLNFPRYLRRLRKAVESHLDSPESQ